MPEAARKSRPERDRTAESAAGGIQPGEVRVGTSGWSYDHWDGPFYPDDLPSSERLRFYASRFSTVEINATFYRLPTEEAVASWRHAVPEGFLFAVKGSRFITHYRKLESAEESIRSFLDRVSGLGESLAVVLWQLPPTLRVDNGLLDRFLGSLPTDGPRHAVEFRHASWLSEATFELLHDHGAAHVHVSSDHMPTDLTPTADFVYARLHGLQRLGYRYPDTSLEPWARYLRDQMQGGKRGFVYFNNDAEAHAPHDAGRLIGMLGEER